MPDIIEGPPEEGAAPRPWGVRLAWFVGLAVAGAGAVAAAAYGMRAVLGV